MLETELTSICNQIQVIFAYKQYKFDLIDINKIDIASRAKLWTVNNFSKMRGQVKNTPYPQPEGTLGETMIKYGKDLGDESNFGNALVEMGESLRQMAGIKYALEDNIKQNFLDPLNQIKDLDLKDVLVSNLKSFLQIRGGWFNYF
jgi:hypothetical protein